MTMDLRCLVCGERQAVNIQLAPNKSLAVIYCGQCAQFSIITAPSKRRSERQASA